VGFKEIRALVIGCLKSGSFEHEIRADIEDKNMLFTGQVSPGDVIDMILACRGNDHQASPHDFRPSIMVHVLKPKGKYLGWYIKFYCIEPGTFFISVHK
jgi:hypothetical protein